MVLALSVAGCHAYDEQLLESARAGRDPDKKQRPPAADSGETSDDAGMAAATNQAGSRSDPTDQRDAAPREDARVDEAEDGGATGPAAGSGGATGPAAGSGGGAGQAGAGGAGPAGPQPAMCTDANGRVWPMNGHCYFPLTGANTWYVARDRCRELGAQLVVITSPEEQAFASMVVGSNTRWLGLSRFGAPAFSWIGAEGVTYENWEAGAPNITGEAAAVMRNDTHLWFDAAVSDAHSPLCERRQQPAVTVP